MATNSWIEEKTTCTYGTLSEFKNNTSWMGDGVLQGSGGVSYLRRELGRRITTPMGHITFWVYLFIGVIGFGAFGVWYELFPWFAGRTVSSDGVYTALLTFFPALAGTSALQLVFDNAKKPLRAFSVAYFACFIGLAVWLGFAKPDNTYVAFGAAVLGCFMAVIMWWLTGGQDPAYQDNIDDTTPLGGDPAAQPHGSLQGFQA